MAKNFNGKYILVVGRTFGIGLSLAKILLENNASVYVISRTKPTDLPGGIAHLQADVAGDLEAISGFLPGQFQGLAISLAAELAGQKIRVNVVAPSLTDTPMAQNLLSSPEKREVSAKRHPLAKDWQPEDISKAIAFLLSDDSSWVTGQVLEIDGGLGKLKTA